MSAPIVLETVRENPIQSDSSSKPLDMHNDSGFPFDDGDFDRERDYSFQSQLDDIAKRHPEFAQHLSFGGSFPSRSNVRNRQRRGSDVSPDTRQQASGSAESHPEFRRRPFPSRFEEFGFPFGRYFEGEPEEFYQEAPERPVYKSHEQATQDPPQTQQQEEVTEQNKQTQATQTENKPPPAPQTERGRKPQNIQQSNTVDLGQKQESVAENRNQRSMSAPPENRTGPQRFVSSINIPIQREGGGDMGARASSQQQEMPQPTSQPHSQNKPTERVIPIHVEGRDEPVIPRNANQNFAQQPQPQPERVFGHKPSHFTQFVNREPAPTPDDSYRQQQQQYQKQQQQNFQKQATPPRQNIPQQQEQPQPKASVPKSTPLDTIQLIQKDVLELMNQVENFGGKPRDKQYLYLDEMLTRNLIKLDNIETEGKDNIRQARKEAIKCIESCIGILEAKANANVAALQAQTALEPTEVANVEQPTEVTNVEQPTEKHAPTEESQPAALEVSGVTRSGSVAQVNQESRPEVVPPAAPMEVSMNPAENKIEVAKNNEEKEKSPKPDHPKSECDQPKPDVVQETPMEVSATRVPESEIAEVSQNQPEQASGDAKEEAKKEKKKGKKKDKSEK